MSMEYDIFIGGPPDRRAPFPYKQMIKDAFPDLAIYDWENYKGDDYQEQNHLAIRQSSMMVSLVPDFPMPGIGPEIGYFYCWHEERIKCDKKGICLGMKRIGTFGNGDPHLGDFIFSEPINYMILIWPEGVQPDFAKRTLAQYGLIVPTVEEAIKAIKANLKNIARHNKLVRRTEKENMLSKFEAAKDVDALERRDRSRKDDGLRYR